MRLYASCFVILQTEHLLLLGIKLFLSDNTHVKQLLELLQIFHVIAFGFDRLDYGSILFSCKQTGDFLVNIDIVFDCLKHNLSGRSTNCDSFKRTCTDSRNLVKGKVYTLAPFGYAIYSLIGNSDAVVLNSVMITIHTRLNVIFFSNILDYGLRAKILSPKEAIGEFFVYIKKNMKQMDELYGYDSPDFLKDVPTNYDDLRAQKHRFPFRPVFRKFKRTNHT